MTAIVVAMIIVLAIAAGIVGLVLIGMKAAAALRPKLARQDDPGRAAPQRRRPAANAVRHAAIDLNRVRLPADRRVTGRRSCRWY